MYANFQELYDHMESHLMTKAACRYAMRSTNAYTYQDIFQCLTLGLYNEWINNHDAIQEAPTRGWLFNYARDAGWGEIEKIIRRDKRSLNYDHAPEDQDAYDFMIESMAEPQQRDHYADERSTTHSVESRQVDFLLDVQNAIMKAFQAIEGHFADVPRQALHDMLDKLRGDNPEYSRAYFKRQYDMSRAKFDAIYHILQQYLQFHLSEYGGYEGVYPKQNTTKRQITNGEEWTDTEIEKMLEMRAEGKAFGAIAHVLGRTRGACWAKYRNMQQRNDMRDWDRAIAHVIERDAVKVEKETKYEQAVKLRQQGMTYDNIAKELGAKSGSSIRQLMRRHGFRDA